MTGRLTREADPRGQRPIAVTVEASGVATYAHHVRQRSEFQAIFRALVAADANARGRLLDIGCGASVNAAVREVYDRAALVHGVDPTPGVLANTGLAAAGRWMGELGAVPVPESFYDMAIAYNVVEHVRDPARFLAAARLALKPSGSLWLLTPNACHPFCVLSRGIELAGLKPMFARRSPGVNDYPAYYALNSRRAVVRHAVAAGFTAARFVHVPCMQWDQYFPTWMRWAPRLYDAAIGLRVTAAMQILICRLSTPADPAGDVTAAEDTLGAGR